MKAILRQARISPKKANLVAGMVRGKKVKDALEILDFLPKKAGLLLYKVVHSAAANAQNNFKQSLDDLFITRLIVTKGPTFKRSLPISRGRTHPILKRTCHITVEVGAMHPSATKMAPKKVDSSEHEPQGAAPHSKGVEKSSEKKTAGKKAVKAKASAPKAKSASKKVTSKK